MKLTLDFDFITSLACESEFQAFSFSSRPSNYQVSLAERSKAPDSSSGGAIRVGSNPTADIYFCT